MERPVTPRMILGMNAVSIANTIASFGQAANVETTNERYVYLSLAQSLATILRQMIGSDEANRLITEQVDILHGCIEVAARPEQLGEEVDAWLRSNQNAA